MIIVVWIDSDFSLQYRSEQTSLFLYQNRIRTSSELVWKQIRTNKIMKLKQSYLFCSCCGYILLLVMFCFHAHSDLVLIWFWYKNREVCSDLYCMMSVSLESIIEPKFMKFSTQFVFLSPSMIETFLAWLVIRSFLHYIPSLLL